MRAAIRKVIALDFATGPGENPPAPEAKSTSSAEHLGSVVLVTKHSLSLKWAPRWLQNSGMDVRVANTASEALDQIRAERPSLIIADASMIVQGKQPLIAELREVHGKEVPLIALCASESEVVTANDANVTDIARQPYDWQVIMRRAVGAIHAHQHLADLREARQRLESLRVSAVAATREQAIGAGLDSLTNLPNNERFRTLLHRAVGTNEESQLGLGILVIGLDRYRMISEAIGRENANRLEKQFADRLKNCLRNSAVVGGAGGHPVTAVAARLGEAKFAILMSDANSDEMKCCKQAVLQQTEQPFEVRGQSIYVTVSIGAALFPRDCADADSLLHGAESAMLEAQESGCGFQFFAKPEETGSARLLDLDRMLREALRNNDLKLAYQPISDTATGRVVGAEALLRWQHVEEGMISPADFVPVAEKSGLMQEIGDFVIATACSQLRGWLDSGMKPIRMAINISLCQLLRGDVVSVVQTALQENHLNPALLEIELSERGVLNQRPEVIGEIHRLKNIGVRISIDDFGTGQAAIAYLKDLPVDVIKIDRSYVSGATRGDRDEAIASGMVALAHRLKATVVAEGVETEEQLETLKEWGSQECQGFLFSPAVDADRFLNMCTSQGDESTP